MSDDKSKYDTEEAIALIQYAKPNDMIPPRILWRFILVIRNLLERVAELEKALEEKNDG